MCNAIVYRKNVWTCAHALRLPSKDKDLLLTLGMNFSQEVAAVTMTADVHVSVATAPGCSFG